MGSLGSGGRQARRRETGTPPGGVRLRAAGSGRSVSGNGTSFRFRKREGYIKGPDGVSVYYEEWGVSKHDTTVKTSEPPG